MTSTLREPRSPSAFSASSTAIDDTDTRERLMPVSVRARLPALSASRKRRLVIGPVVPSTSASSYARRTWPWISFSPTIIESSPAATLNRCRTASVPRSE